MAEVRIIPDRVIDFDNEELWKTFRHHCFYIDSSIEEVEFNESKEVVLQLNKHAEVEDRVQALLTDIQESFSRVETETLFECEGTNRAHEVSQPILQHLSQKGDVTATSPGEYSYQGDFLRVFRAVDALFLKVAGTYNSIEQHFPTTVPIEVVRANGYLSNFPHNAMFVSNLKDDLEVLKHFTTEVQTGREKSLAALKEGSSFKAILNPTVCYHCFESQRDKSLGAQQKIYTALNKCHRYEGKQGLGLHRLQVFNMREIIFFGSQEEVLEVRTRIIDDLKKILGNLGLKSRIISASDPFFAGDALSSRAFQSIFKLKYEMQVYIPEIDSWIAAGSFNAHGDKLTKAYGIDVEGNELSYSGCFGVGYERFIYGLYSQISANPDDLIQIIQNAF